MKIKKQKGFTIIEIVVVIIIILALEAIIWVSVSKYDKRGKDSAMLENMSSLLTRAATYFSTNQNYNDFCGSDSGALPIENAITAPNIGSNFVCNCDTASCAGPELATSWCACSAKISAPENVFCVDSTGFKKEVKGIDCDTECPDSGLNPGVCRQVP